MSLTQYKITATSFDRYFDEFLYNAFRQLKYRITLVGGETAIGVPVVNLAQSPQDQNVRFFFKTEDGFYRIPFLELTSAELL